MPAVRDLRPDLLEIEAGLREIGLPEQASELRDTCTAAWTTSSEMLGEIGLVLRRIKNSRSKPIPGDLRARIDSCLREIRKVWPGLR